MTLPQKIKFCPITESIFEIRYSSEYPVDAIFGVLYAAIKDLFTQKPVPLPILQLPESVREQDPAFKYQAYHRLIKDNMIFSIGPRVLTFANHAPYTGWEKWSAFFYEVLEKILNTDVLSNIDRIGLRYVNFFEENIFNNVKFEVKVNNKVLNEESTNLRTEFIDGEYIKILQIGNAVNIKKNNKYMNGSIIDIDCLRNINNTSEFIKDHTTIIEEAHYKEKELFFSLLEDEFLNKLKPDYGG